MIFPDLVMYRNSCGNLRSRFSLGVRANNQAFAAEVDRDEMALVEEIEDFALEDMGKMLTTFDINHPLLVAVASVRDLGFNTYDSDEEGD